MMLENTPKQLMQIGLCLVLGLGSLYGCSKTSSPASPTVSTAATPPPSAFADSASSTVTMVTSGDISQIEPIQSDPIETANLATLTLNLADAQGAPYDEVRDRIIASGWIPHTFAETTGPESDFQDSTVQSMENLGLMEVKSCSGTGQGFCRFEFVYQERTADNGPILAVTTTATSPGESNFPMPNFWGLEQENISDLRYSDRAFDQELFTQLQEQEMFCLGVGQCEQTQYMLKDALLVAATGGFGTTTISLIPDTPVSKEEAIAHARTLDTESVIDFGTVEFDDELNTENYYEALPASVFASELGGITAIQLQITPDGQVSEISFSMIVL